MGVGGCVRVCEVNGRIRLVLDCQQFVDGCGFSLMDILMCFDIAEALL